MSTKTILITGGHGFIGSNMIRYYLNKYPGYQLVNIDYNTDAASPANIECPEVSARYSFHRVDIRNAYAINHLFELYNITDILHFAAETRDIDKVGEIRLYEQTNVLGTLNLLQAAQDAWMKKEHQPKADYATSRFHHISVSAIGDDALYNQSKAKTDRMVREFYEKYGLNVVTTASPQVFGPMQQEIEQIPTYIRQVLDGDPVTPIENWSQLRDWLFVGDLCEAIDTVFHLGDAGQRYKTGATARLSDGELAELVASLQHSDFPGNIPVQGQLKERSFHTRFKSLQKTQSQIPGFAPFTPLGAALRITFDWYSKKYKYANLSQPYQ